jgi:hypothetical protein
MVGIEGRLQKFPNAVKKEAPPDQLDFRNGLACIITYIPRLGSSNFTKSLYES